MNTRYSLSSFVALTITMSALSCASLAAGRGVQKTGARGGSVSGSTTQAGNKVSGSGTATTASGKTATATGTATAKPGAVSAQGSANGFNGGTASGTATATNGAVNASGTATSAAGKSVSGTVAAAPGTATVTSGTGNSRTFTRGSRPTPH